MKTHSRQSASKNRIENKSAVLATKLGLIFPAILALLLAASMASAQTETVLYNFDSLTSIGYPLDAPYIDSAGNLYGTAENGRPFLGGVFELSPPTAQGGSWAESLLYGFTSVPDGAFPTSGLVRDSNGALYGQTWMGGTSDYGTVFQLSPPAISGGAWTETTLYTFTDILFSAGYPGSGLIFDKSGNLYGTKGSNSGGLVFELSPPSSSGGTWTYTAIYSFDDQTNFAGGCDPNGLLTGPNGSFYGTASSCGANNGGVVFKLTPPANGVGEWTQTLVHTFSALKTTSDGNVPDSRLVHRKGGVLFGTTYQGGSANLGTVYELTPKTGGTWTERVIHSFHTDGSHPQGAVSVGPNGVLYVTASSGGVSGGGSVIQLTPPATSSGAWTETTLVSFPTNSDNAMGSNPMAGVAQFKGALYGTTQYGGANNSGTVFEITF